MYLSSTTATGLPNVEQTVVDGGCPAVVVVIGLTDAMAALIAAPYRECVTNGRIILAIASIGTGQSAL